MFRKHALLLPQKTASSVATAPSEAEATRVDTPTADRHTRRQFVRQCLGMWAATMTAEGIAEPAQIEVTTHTLPIAHLRQPIRVVQLTDLHRSHWVSEGYIARVVALTNRLRPDLVVLTGDFVTRSSDYAESCAAQLVHLKSPLGLYGTLGNHDYYTDDFRGAPAVANTLADAGIQFLINRSVRLDNDLMLVGVDDVYAGHPDPILAFEKVRPDDPVLALTHNPLLFDWVCHYDYTFLAGHTHGGQIHIPGVFDLAIGDSTRYLRGWYQKVGRPGRIYVSRGLGVVNLPFRFRSRPEIALFHLVPG